MRGNKCSRFLCCFILLASSWSTGIRAAETDFQQIKRDIVSAWIVEIQGDARTRTLHIRGAERKRDENWDLDASYGWTGRHQTTVKSELTVKPDGYKLTFTTQANSLIVAEGSGAGILIGTFTAKSGNIKPVKLTRITEEDLSKLQASPSTEGNRKIVQPGPEVPIACGSLVGGWTGNWGYQGYDEGWLWVVQVDSACIAKYRFGRTGYRGPFKTAEIRKGVLSTPCNDGGTCSFERQGNRLFGRWDGPAGTHSWTFEKGNIDAK